jgi:hypothetical protein
MTPGKHPAVRVRRCDSRRPWVNRRLRGGDQLHSCELIYSARKWARLALASNPTFPLSLFLPDAEVVHRDGVAWT